jgi:hypothetical protein
MHVLLLDRFAAEVLEQAAAAMFDALNDVHNAEPMVDAAARTVQLQQLFDARLHALGLRLTAERDGRMHPLMQGLGMPLEPRELDQTLERARNEYRARIQLAVSTLHTRREGTMMNNTFNGPVGAFQTGTHATATVTQVASNSGSIQAVHAAIDGLVEMLRSAPGLSEDHRIETIEILNDVKTEAEKEKPNKSKLGGLLSGAGTMIQTIPNAAPAWAQVVAWYEAISTVAKGVIGP